MSLEKILFAAGQNTTPVSSDEYFENVALLLKTSPVNGAANASVTDSSSAANTVTNTGPVAVNATSPLFPSGYWSYYFDGSGDYFTIPSNAALSMGASNFTIEFWIYPTSFSTSNRYVWFKRVAVAARGIGIGFEQTTGKVKVLAGDSNTTAYEVDLLSTNAVPLYAWSHIAVTRDSSTWTIYINGESNGTATSSITVDDSTGTAYIGTAEGTVGFIAGYVSNLRVVKGSVVYTGNFTPPSAPISAISNTQLLTCQSNRNIDNSSNSFAITVNGNSSVKRFSPFNLPQSYSTTTYLGSAYFDGSGDYLDTTASAGNFGTGDFTVEMWINTPNASSGMLIDTRPTSSASTGWVMHVSTNGTLQLTNNNTSTLTSTNAISPNSWQHVALVRNSGTVRFYINGVSTNSASSSASFTPTNFRIGVRSFSTSSVLAFEGHISNLRVVIGTAVYTGNFTPPTSPLTNISGTSLLLNFTTAGIYDATGLNTFINAGSIQASTEAYKFSPTSVLNDGNNDYSATLSNPPLVLGTANFTIDGWLYRTGLNPVNSTFSIQVLDYRTAEPSTQILIEKASSSTKLELWVNGVSRIISTSDLTLNTWIFFAIVRNAGITRLYINGVQEGVNYTDTNNYTSSTPVIGGRFAAVSGDYRSWVGNYQDIRITPGIARYTSNFTPPSAPFPTK